MSDSPLQAPELPAIGLVADLSAEDRALLSSYGEFMQIPEKTVVIKQGDSQDSLFFLIAGALHARRNEGGREMLMGRINAGEWFGEVNIFDPAEASATVVAVNYSQIWKITRDALNEFIQNHPLAANYLTISVAQVLSRRVRTLAQRVVEEAQMAALRASLASGLGVDA